MSSEMVTLAPHSNSFSTMLYCLDRIAVWRGVLPDLSCLFVSGVLNMKKSYKMLYINMTVSASSFLPGGTFFMKGWGAEVYSSNRPHLNGFPKKVIPGKKNAKKIVRAQAQY